MIRLPLLYSFRRCPYAMRARLALQVSGTVCAIREIVLRDKPVEMIAASAKATVPVLVLPDGRVIDQSIDIMRWALAQHDPESWLDGDDATLIARNDGPFKRHLDRYKYPNRHDGDPAEDRAAGLKLLHDLDARLANTDNLCGSGRSLADMAIMPFVRQFAQVDRDWFDAQPMPALHIWLARHMASDLFGQIMTKLPPWHAGDAPVLFPTGLSYSGGPVFS
jgi:glutathione S-transferase